MHDRFGIASGTDPFGLYDELTDDEVGACCRARSFVDEQVLPVLARLDGDEPLPEALLVRAREEQLSVAGESPVARGLVAMELSRGDARLSGDQSTPGIPAWTALGQATAAHDIAVQHWAIERALGNPLASSRRVADALDRLAEDLAAMQLLCLHLGRWDGAPDDTIALAVRHNVRTARAVVGMAHDLLGPDGDRPERHLVRHVRALAGAEPIGVLL